MSEIKSPEQIAAELELEAQMKAAIDAALNEKKKAAGDLHFVHDGDVYQIIYPKVIIPELGERTALDITIDEEAQQVLVNGQSEAIKKII